MAAPSIPNLKTLRGGRVRDRGRGLSSLGGPSSRNAEEDRTRNDRIVQQTDQDASVSRMSAVEAGYLDDPFAKHFVSSETQRRFPIINRGTYVRTRIIDKLVDDFLETAPSQKKQIISLGAGTDTRYFRIISRYAVHEKPNFVYHEIDFAENTARKLTAVKRYGELAGCVRVPASYYSGPDAATETSTIVDSPYYHLHPVDLRTLDQSKEPPCTFRSIDTSLPTVIISECCLVYLTPTAADIVALYFTKHLFPPNTPLGMILYEPINPHDPFGKVMVSNLAARGIVLQTLRKYGSLEAQAVRMKAYGFNDSRGADVNKLWIEGVDEKEKERVAALEMIDEVEEWELLAGHYSVIWGWRNAEADGENGVWERWKAPFS